MAVNIEALLKTCVEKNATDIYLTVGSPATLRFGSQMQPFENSILNAEDIQQAMQALLTPDIIEEFESTLEYNTAITWKNEVRFRVNVFRQRQQPGIVLRRIHTNIPTIASLNLPQIYADLIMERRGLILVVGPTGSGKSTSLAAMLQHRNMNGSGHIVTIEDPIEYLIEHKNCIVTQRDVGIDTYSFGIALKNALRQTPDVIVIGEIRDRETMEHAIVFSETGHLCLATLHANNANQAIERIINFFPEERHKQILLNLSLNLKAILSQRLVQNVHGSRTVALEVLLNQGLIRSLIHEGRVKEIKDYIEKGRDEGMQTFDQALIDLFVQGHITEEMALAESDNPANLRLALKQHEMSRRATSPFRSLPPGLGIINKQQF